MELDYYMQKKAVGYAIQYLEEQIYNIKRHSGCLPDDGYKLQLLSIKNMYEKHLEELETWYESEVEND